MLRCSTSLAVFSTLAGMLALFSNTACSDPDLTLPPSLTSPRALAVAQGEVCMRSMDIEGLIEIDIFACPSNEQGAIGLVVDEQTDRIAVVDMSLRQPRLVNLDIAVPGVTHIPVGRYPVDVDVSTDGTVAYAANQLDRSLTPINLWRLRAFEDTISLPGTPEKLAVSSSTDQVVVALNHPAQLFIHEGYICEQPANLDDRRSGASSDRCELRGEREPQILELPGAIADMELSPDGQLAYIVYTDRNLMSVVALTEDVLSAQNLTCAVSDAQTPCLVESIRLVDASAPQLGFSALSVDPLGVFVYVNDRARSQLLVVDAKRLEVIDAAAAVEPPLAAPLHAHGIPVMRSPVAIEGDIVRTVVWENPADSQPAHALIRYTFGAHVASTNGSIYFAEAMTTYCEVTEESRLLSERQFYSDLRAVSRRNERHCLFVPQWPIDAQDESTLEHRQFQNNGVNLAINPVFALSDSRSVSGRVSSRTSCRLSDEQLELMRAVAPENVVISARASCTSPLLPQPVATLAHAEALAEGETSVARAELLQRQTLILEANDDGQDVEASVIEQTYDIRLRDESWTVTYEGVLPQTQREDGLVDADEGETFHTGGADLCAAGVQVGDRLTILSRPGTQGEVPEECEHFEQQDNFTFRTYEITEFTPYSVQLSVIEDDSEAPEFAQDLPSRVCFPRGLRFQIRAHEQWVVVGEQSGYVSDLRHVDGQCVARPGAEYGRLNARVATGETFVGPYLSFYLYEGDVSPVQDTQFTFQVERNFVAQRIESNTAMATELSLVRNLPHGDFLIAPDLSGNFVFLRNLTIAHERSQYLR